MIKKYTEPFIATMILGILVTVIVIVATINNTNELASENNNHTLELDEAIKMLKEKFDKVFSCAKKKSCNLYAIEVIVIVTPTRGDLYDVHIYTGGLNYTRGSTYSDTVTRRVVVNKFSYHILMLSDGILRGYKE